MPAEMVQPERDRPGMVAMPWARPTSSTSFTVALRAVLRPVAIRSEQKRMQPVTSRAQLTNTGLLPRPSTYFFTGRMRNRGRVPTMTRKTRRRVSGGSPLPGWR